MNDDLTNKFRPQSLEEVFGQDSTVKSLQTLFDDKIPHSFLLSGNSGVGKTTIGRIIGIELKCGVNNLIEIDAATHTGVDSMRELCKGLRYSAHGTNNIKVVIIDECHRLSGSSWDSLLKIIEEPPSHLYFIFCTTELSKVPKTIQTRCIHYNLKDVKTDDLMDLLEDVCKEENISLDNNSLLLIAREAYGSPRRALSYLSKCRGCKNLKEIKEVLEQPLEDSKVIDLCRLLIGRRVTWEKLKPIISDLKDVSQEGVRIQICNYLNSCILKSRTPGEAFSYLQILDAFSKPVYQPTGVSDLLLNVGSIVFNKEGK